MINAFFFFFFFSSRRRHTRSKRDWSSDVCSSDLFACSRKREFLADACGAQFTRYPEGLASALEKLCQAGVPATFANKTTAALCIVNPLSAASLFSSRSEERRVGKECRSRWAACG